MKPRFSGHCTHAWRATIFAAGVLATCVAPGAAAQDRADIDRTQIIGNRELPKVLTIVPWKRPVPGELVARPIESVLDEALAPVDRDVFRRQVRYSAAIEAQAAGGGAGSGAAGGAAAPAPQARK